MPAAHDDHARMPFQLPFPPDALSEIVIPDAPHANEVVVALVLGIGGRPLHRIGPAK
jgi:hypothetical protein